MMMKMKDEDDGDDDDDDDDDDVEVYERRGYHPEMSCASKKKFTNSSAAHGDARHPNEYGNVRLPYKQPALH